MKMNKTNLAFGTLLCAVTLSSMMMAHSNMVHADTNDADMQGGAAAMQFDEDVQNVENSDIQARQVAQTKNMMSQSAQPQNAGTVERERDSRLISTVHSVSQSKDNQGNVLLSNTRNNYVNVHYVDLNGNDIKDRNVEDSKFYWNDAKYPIPKGYLIGDGLSYRKHDVNTSINQVIDPSTVSGEVRYQNINDSSSGISELRDSDLNLDLNMSKRLYNAIVQDSKSEVLLHNWSNVKNYVDFTNYNEQNYGYYLTLGFPETLLKDNYGNIKYSDLANRRPENLSLIGLRDECGDDVDERFAKSDFIINIGKRDPELAKYIYDTVIRRVDGNILDGSIDIGHNKLENADGTLHITLKLSGTDPSEDYHNEYTYNDLTNLVRVDKTKLNTVDVPIIKRDDTVQGQMTTVTRTIKFNFPNNKVPESYRKICNSDGSVKQLVRFYKDPIVDTITGRIVNGYYGSWIPVKAYEYNRVNESVVTEPTIRYDYSDWVRDTSKYAGQFPPITFPRVPGFTLHINKA